MSSTPRTPPSKAQSKAQKAPAAKATTHDTKSNLLSEECELVLHTAFVNARMRRHEFITVEHLLYGLADAPASRDALIACGADIDNLKSKLSVFIDENTPVVDDSKGEVDTQPTLGFQRVIQRSIMQVRSSGESRRQVGSNDVLIGIFGEKDSHAVYYLHQQGVTRLDLVNFISNGIRKDDTATKTQSDLNANADLKKAGQEFFTFVEATRSFAAPRKREGERPKLFISYSHVDTACLDRLLVHLKPLERVNTVVCWSDKRLRAGDKWKRELEKSLDDAVIAILLVSADFLASDFIVNNELPPLLIKADSKGLRILPVILKPCGFRRDPILSTFQSANDPASPLLGLSPIEQEELYDKIADEVAKEVASKHLAST